MLGNNTFSFSDSMVFIEENLALVILNSSQKGMMGSCFMICSSI